MSPIVCPTCGAKAEGNFCSSCGGALGGRFCNQCGGAVEPEARFCNHCGHALTSGAPAQVGRSGAATTAEPRADAARRAGWIAVGASLLFIIGVVVWPTIRAEAGGGRSSVTSPAAPPAGASAVDLSSMTPREAADRLFERIMTSAEAGDSSGVQEFLPMAVAAYERARPLDADGFFHLSLLHRTGGDYQSALGAAVAGMEDYPDHLLNLAAAGRAARDLGETDSARDYFQRLLDVWDVEQGRALAEYEAHGPLLPELRQEAETFLGR